MKKAAALCVLIASAACAPAAVTPERAAALCEQRARAAQAPTGGVTIGANSNTGPSASVNIGLSADLLAGRDPLEVYQNCVFDRTGEAAIRPPVLR